MSHIHVKKRSALDTALLWCHVALWVLFVLATLYELSMALNTGLAPSKSFDFWGGVLRVVSFPFVIASGIGGGIWTVLTSPYPGTFAIATQCAAVIVVCVRYLKRKPAPKNAHAGH